jgi:hypothetical protein
MNVNSLIRSKPLLASMEVFSSYSWLYCHPYFNLLNPLILMTNKNFYHNSTVISTQGFFTKEMKQKLFEKFDGMKQSPFHKFSDLAIKETGCTK